MNRPLLDIAGLRAGYDGEPVLRGCDLTVCPGERWAVVGPNGSGKTTLLRVLSGILAPWDGTVRLDGRLLAEWPRRARARRIGYVPAETTVEFAYTAREIVLMGRAPHLGFLQMERPQDVALAREAMGMTDTLPFENRPVTLLSSGERQRVIIARALAQTLPGLKASAIQNGPALLLLDEPTSHLDLAHAVGVLDLLTRLAHETRMALVAVFHDLSLAASWCDRMALLAAGKVVGVGRPEEVLQPDVLEEVYGIGMHVASHPVTGKPLVTPIGRGRVGAASSPLIKGDMP